MEVDVRPRRYQRIRTALFGCLALVAVTGFVMSRPDSAPGEVLLFDEFDGPAGTSPDPAVWGYALGDGGWGNDEEQTYTDHPDNVRLDGEGHLLVEARSTPDGYTSARLTTLDRFDFTFGRAEARIKVPGGQGLHPAFWLLGTDIEEVGWPRSGEIDVMETINDADSLHTGIHGPTVSGAAWKTSAGFPEPVVGNFHRYWVERAPGRITVGIDDTTVHTYRRPDLAPDQQWVFDKPFFLLLNVAVGGRWPGPVGPDTAFPATMVIDWIKVTDA